MPRFLRGLLASAVLVGLAAAGEADSAAEVRAQPVKDWQNCKECGQPPADPRFRGYTSGNFHSKFHGNWFKDDGKGPKEWYGTVEKNQRPAPRTIPTSRDVLLNKDSFPEENTADSFHVDYSTRPADVTPDLGVASAINATASAINENLLKPVANALPNVTLPDLTSERRRTPATMRKPIVMRKQKQVIPCNESNVTSNSTSADSPKPFTPCKPGGCEKKEKYTKCVKDSVRLPSDEDRANTDAPLGGVAAVASAGNDTFVRKCRAQWFPHPMCVAEAQLIALMMPRTNGTQGVQPSTQAQRNLWLEGKTRAAANCAMCEMLVDFKATQDALTPINCAAAEEKKSLAIASRTTLLAELAELKVELQGAKWNVTHNETIPDCPAPCKTPRTDTMLTRQQKVVVTELKIQRKQEEVSRVSTAIVMLTDMNGACPRLREHVENYELELRAEVSEWDGEKIALREICRKMQCCS